MFNIYYVLLLVLIQAVSEPVVESESIAIY